MTNNIGIVVIGRNEGARLKVCLDSVVNEGVVVYVDSGSTDNSIAIATDLGVDVVNLDITIPFTAARARNEGFLRLQKRIPDLDFVQFVDGDCEVVKGWFDAAKTYLEQNDDVAVVCGRRRERYPNTSIYNMLCDIEWDTPIGEANACGGDALIRACAFDDVHGFDPAVIAGEEPELCVRLRHQAWRVWRIDEKMTLHDANMTQFSQWWLRNVRSGYAFALGASMHGGTPERHWVAEVIRARVWGAYIPLLVLIATILEPVFIVAIMVYPIQIARIAMKNSINISKSWLYAFYLTLGKFPEMQGQLKFYINRLFKKRSEIIEYKS